MVDKTRKWRYLGEGVYAPLGDIFKRYAFYAKYNSTNKVLAVEELNKLFAVHAVIQFTAESFEDAERILDSILRVATVLE